MWAGMEVVVGRHAGQSQGGLVARRGMLNTSWVRGEDTRSHRLPGVQLWVGSSQNWSVFRGRPSHGMP